MMRLKEIVSKYQYDRKIRTYADRYYFDDIRIFANIKSKQDIEIAERQVLSRIETYEKTFPLEREDVIDLEKAMGRFEISVKKAIHCYDLSNGSFSYNAEELQSLIDKIFKYHEKVEQIGSRRLMQD